MNNHDLRAMTLWRYAIVSILVPSFFVGLACSTTTDAASPPEATREDGPGSATAPEGGQSDSAASRPYDLGAVTGQAFFAPSISFSPNGRAVVFEQKTGRRVRLTVLLPDGERDPAWGESGKPATIAIPAAREHSEAVLGGASIGDDGTVFLRGGMRFQDGSDGPFIARLNNGALDATFGQGGVLRFDLGGLEGDVRDFATVRDPGGNVAGYVVLLQESFSASRLVWLGATGIRDMTVDSPTIPGRTFSLSVDTNGRIWVIDETGLRRFTASGKVDTDFGVKGRVALVSSGFIYSSLLLHDGSSLVTVGNSESRSLIRLSTAGAAVDTFPQAGTNTLPGPGFQEMLQETPDHKLLALTRPDKVHDDLRRFNADGSPDTAFAQNGAYRIETSETADDNTYLYRAQTTNMGKTMVATCRFHYVAPGEATAVGPTWTQDAKKGIKVVDWAIRRLP